MWSMEAITRLHETLISSLSSSFMSRQFLNMHEQIFYGNSPAFPVLGSPRFSIIVKHKILQSSLIMSIQCFFGPAPLPYLVSSSKYCYLWISVVIHSHNMTKVSQAKLPYPVVYFLPQIEMFPNAIIAQPVSLYNDENPPEKCHLKYIQSMF